MFSLSNNCTQNTGHLQSDQNSNCLNSLWLPQKQSKVGYTISQGVILPFGVNYIHKRLKMLINI